MSTTVQPSASTSRRPQAVSRGTTGDRWGAVLVVGAPALLALGLCAYRLTTRSLWLDESATFSIASQHGGALAAAIARDGGNMLAYYALLHVLIGWFGSGSLVLRLPAVIGAAATVALVAILGLRLANRRVALSAAVLTAVSLSLVYWGQDARGYTPMIALITASFLPLLALLERRGGATAWFGYVGLMTMAIYVGLEAALVIPAQLLALAWFRGRWRTLVSAVLLTALFSVPLALLAAERGAGQLFWVPRPSFSVLKQIVEALTSSALQPSFYTSTTTVLTVLSLIVLAGGAVRVVSLARYADARRPALLLSWLLVPAFAALIESTVGQSIFQARYLLVSLPAVSLAIAWVLFDWPIPRPGRFRWLASAGAVAALIALRALQLAPAYGVSPENWRAATNYVTARTASGDCAAFYPSDARMPFRYYVRNVAGAPRPIIPALPWSRIRPFVEDYASLTPVQLAQLPAQCARVWLITRRGGGVGGTPISHANSVRFEELASGLARRYPLTRSRAFGQAGLVTVTLYSR